MSTDNPPPFRVRTVFGLITFGALAFLLMLWLIGSGETGGNPNNGDAHAASNGLTGFSALGDLLEAQGFAVSTSRNPGALDREGLLVLTPPMWADGAEIAEIIEARRYAGPTLLVLPKWNAVRVPDTVPGANEGWVALTDTSAPAWLEDLGDAYEISAETGYLDGGTYDWRGLGLQGRLPERDEVMILHDNGSVVPLVADKDGDILAAYLDDGGYYPVLEDAVGLPDRDPQDFDSERWNVIVVAEPDLMNNYGMADPARAALATRIVDLAREGEDLPVVFDLTSNGLGKTQNLLTLAFTPPFLAATLCLVLAAVMVAWRAFRRFGAPVAEARTIAFGKRRLVANSAGFILRSRRLRLLGPPYVAMVGRRLATKLGLRHADPEDIDAALARRLPDAPSFSERSAALLGARGPSAILRAAHELRSIERILAQ